MNIYVSHLSWGTKSDSLQNLFSQYGEVSSANVITDRETGRSRGFGFVEMPNETEGQAAIDALDGTDFEGKTIGVNVAKPKADRPAGGYGGGNRGGGYGGGYGNRRSKLPYGIYHPCFMRLRQGSLCPVSQGYEEIPEGCSVSERGRRTPEHREKGGNCRPHRPGLACRVTRGAHQNFARITVRLKAGHTPDRK